MTRYVIVGTGVAGISAAQAIRTTDQRAEITLVSEDPYGFYSRPGLAYYLSGEIPEKQLLLYTKEDWKQLNVHLVPGRVSSLFPQEHRLEVERRGVLTYDRLLLAVGAKAVRLTLPGADLQGVAYLDSFEDARSLVMLARRARRAVVVGGGITSLELTEGLAARGVHVHYLLRGDRYWPAVLDEQESRLVEQHLVKGGVTLHFRSELVEVLGKRGRVVAVRTQKGETIPCDLLGVAVGTRPRLELAQLAGLEIDRGILVNEYMATSAPDIFAAGDCAQIFDPVSGQAIMETLWNPARKQGYTAGLNMAGRQTAYRHSPSFNVTRLAGLTVTIIGSLGGSRDEDLLTIARGESESWRFGLEGVTLHQAGDVNRLRLVIGKKSLLGALLIGDQTLSVPLQELICDQTDITPVREQLLASNAALDQILFSFWQKTHLQMSGVQ
jgi:NADPH-dependent 2,4-dienoyl-CoA reductase/sulfur reductase-like enzyme